MLDMKDMVDKMDTVDYMNMLHNIGMLILKKTNDYVKLLIDTSG